VPGRWRIARVGDRGQWRYARQCDGEQPATLPGLDPTLPFDQICGDTLTKARHESWRAVSPLHPGLAVAEPGSVPS
jgi:hypothetical protein